MGGIPSYECDEITSCMSKDALEQAFDVIYKKSVGYVVKYDLKQLIKEIRVNPECSEDELNNFGIACVNAGLNVPLRRSTISRE